MPKLDGTYSEGNCGVQLRGGEPYVLLNLEMFYDQNPEISGRRCDFVYICFKDGEWNVFVVELKDIQDLGNNPKKVIRDDFQGKFSQTLNVLNTRILPFFNISGKIKRKARIVVPYIVSYDDNDDILNTIGALIKKDKTLMGELYLFDDVVLIPCYGDIWSSKSSSSLKLK